MDARALVQAVFSGPDRPFGVRLWDGTVLPPVPPTSVPVLVLADERAGARLRHPSLGGAAERGLPLRRHRRGGRSGRLPRARASGWKGPQHLPAAAVATGLVAEVGARATRVLPRRRGQALGGPRRRRGAQPLRRGQRLLPALPRSADGLLLRLLGTGGARRWRRPRSPSWSWSAASSGSQPRPALPRHRLRLGSAGEPRHAGVRRPGHRHHPQPAAAGGGGRRRSGSSRLRAPPSTSALTDYRQLPADERWDAVASVGMMEHVGRAQLGRYFALAGRAPAAPGGLLLNHAIAENGERSERTIPWLHRTHGGFIQQEIFPDSDLPPLERVVDAAQHAGLRGAGRGDDARPLRPDAGGVAAPARRGTSPRRWRWWASAGPAPGGCTSPRRRSPSGSAASPSPRCCSRSARAERRRRRPRRWYRELVPRS